MQSAVAKATIALVVVPQQHALTEVVAERLRLARLRAGLTQTEVAQRLSIASNTVSGWESGTRSPRAPELYHLAKLYRCTADYLVGVCESPSELPVGDLLIDIDLAERILRCRNEVDIARLVEWDPHMITFWHVVRRGTRVGSQPEVEAWVSRLVDHVRKIAPQLWLEFEQARRTLTTLKQRSWTRISNETSDQL